VKESKSGKPYFVLNAGNDQVIGQSEMYDSASACQSGIASVTNNAAGATTDDQTSPQAPSSRPTSEVALHSLMCGGWSGLVTLRTVAGDGPRSC